MQGLCCHRRVDPVRAIEKPLVPPKSLGELGLEIFKDCLLSQVMKSKFPEAHIVEAPGANHKNIMEALPLSWTYDEWKENIRRLRKIMWHRGHITWVYESCEKMCFNPTYAQAFQFGRIVEKSRKEE